MFIDKRGNDRQSCPIATVAMAI